MNGIAIGPTWQRAEDGKFVLPPQRSLGWRMIGWARTWLRQPDGPKAGEPWEFTQEQARFLGWWYALDEDGRFAYRSGVYRRMKGAGKNPFAAVISAIELLGPCRPTGRVDDQGYSIGEVHYSSWVQMAAVSREQTRNSMTLMPSILSQEAIEEFGIDMGKEIIYAQRGRCRMEAVTSSPRALEGGRATFIVMDETQHWLRSNEGHEMAKVIARNAAKSRDGASRVLAITNAHAPGEDSVGEHDYEACMRVVQGVSAVDDFLYDSLEAPETDLKDDESVLAGILAARGDSEWIDPQRLLAEIRDPRTTPAVARRFYLNQIVAEEDKPFDVERWGELVNGWMLYTGRKEPAPGRLITLGFDGSVTRDHTAMIGTDVITGYQWVVGYWEPEELPDGTMAITVTEVEQTAEDAFEKWQVWRLYADPYKWAGSLSKWAGEYGSDIVSTWNTTLYRKMALALAEYKTAISGGDVSHDGDPRFAASLGNAHKHMMAFRNDDGELMWIIQKERVDSPLKIDAAMAGCLSWQAREDAIADGAVLEETAGVFFA